MTDTDTILAGLNPIAGDREALYRAAQDIPTHHNPAFAPVIHPTLETGVQAMTAAALGVLVPPRERVQP